MKKDNIFKIVYNIKRTSKVRRDEHGLPESHKWVGMFTIVYEKEENSTTYEVSSKEIYGRTLKMVMEDLVEMTHQMRPDEIL